MSHVHGHAEDAVSGDNQTDPTEGEKTAVDTILHMLGEKQRKLVMGVVSPISLKYSYMAGHEYEKLDVRRELLKTGLLEGLQDSTTIWQSVFRSVYTYYDLC